MVYVVKSGKSIVRSCVIVLIDSDFCVRNDSYIKFMNTRSRFAYCENRYMPKSLMTYWFAYFQFVRFWSERVTVCEI